MRLRYILLLTLFINTHIVSAQIFVPKEDYVQEIRKSRYSLAICLISGANSTGVSFGMMRQNPDSTHEVIFLTKTSFVRQASGNEKSKGNPNKINHFKENNIDVAILGELWKLRYNKNPYSDELGWGTKHGVPSKTQFNMLSQFGAYKLKDYIFGEELWLFLQKVSDPTWVGQYQINSGE